MAVGDERRGQLLNRVLKRTNRCSCALCLRSIVFLLMGSGWQFSARGQSRMRHWQSDQRHTGGKAREKPAHDRFPHLWQCLRVFFVGRSQSAFYDAERLSTQLRACDCGYRRADRGCDHHGPADALVVSIKVQRFVDHFTNCIGLMGASVADDAPEQGQRARTTLGTGAGSAAFQSVGLCV